MKNYLIIISILFANCINKKEENKAIIQINDTLRNNASLEKANRIFNNPFRDINNFNIIFGNKFIDSLHDYYIKDKVSEIALTNDICIGDGCESYQTILNKNNHTNLYFFKGDCGEYGFSNDQFYLQNDSLKFVRNFDVEIETWSTDSSDTIWRIEEKVFKFSSGIVSCLIKTELTKNLDQFDFNIKNATSSKPKVGWKETYITKLKELEDHLKRKDSKDLNE